MGVDECIISYWDRPAGRVESLGYYPPHRLQEIEPSFEVADFPETLRVLETQVTVIVDADDPAADPAEVELMRSDGNTVLAMLPLVAKGQSIGLVELISNGPVAFDDERLGLARTMANEAAMALENARLYEDARALADRDPLTGFYNHRFLHERLGEEVVRAQRARRPLSVLMLDLDDFKLVNDTFGHLFGDRVLTWTAELIRSTLRGLGHPGPLRRRRVRDHPARDRRRRGPARRRADPRGVPRPRLRRRAARPGADRRVHRRRDVPGRRPDRHRAHRRRRRGALPGQARRRPRRRGSRRRRRLSPHRSDRSTDGRRPTSAAILYP